MSLLPATVALIARQIKQLSSASFEGVRHVPSDSMTEVLADVDGPAGTPYEGGVFRVRLTLGADFPSAPPKGERLFTFVAEAQLNSGCSAAAPRGQRISFPPKHNSRRARAPAHHYPPPPTHPLFLSCNTSRLILDEDIPPKCVACRRDLCQHPEEGLAAGAHARARAAGDPLPSHRAVPRILAE